jgi:hypothetical protein
MSDEIEDAQDQFENAVGWVDDAVQKLHKAALKAARTANCKLVPVSRLAALEQLEAAVFCALNGGVHMTRDYKDVQESHRVAYRGKKFLVDREHGNKVASALNRCRRVTKK